MVDRPQQNAPEQPASAPAAPKARNNQPGQQSGIALTGLDVVELKDVMAIESRENTGGARRHYTNQGMDSDNLLKYILSNTKGNVAPQLDNRDRVELDNILLDREEPGKSPSANAAANVRIKHHAQTPELLVEEAKSESQSLAIGQGDIGKSRGQPGVASPTF